MGHYCILAYIALLLAPEAQGMEGHHGILHILEEKLNLQLLKCGGVKVLVNMVYATSIP